MSANSAESSDRKWKRAQHVAGSEVLTDSRLATHAALATRASHSTARPRAY